MYTSYFGFDHKPFKPKDSHSFYRNADFDAACAAILGGVRARRGVILLTGEAGLGKTLILNRCMAEADDIRFVLLNNAHLDFSDILNYLSADLGLRDEGMDVDQRNRQLLDTLAAYASRGQAVALLVDDAHHLRLDALQRLWTFVAASAPEPHQQLQVVLAGLPDIEGRLRQPELQPLQAAIRVRYRLARLSAMETGLFIAHQLNAAGYAGSDLLSPAALERVAHYGQGAPRAIALLCDTVLLFASLQSEREITPAMVDEAARSCFLGDHADATLAPGRVTLAEAGDEFDLNGAELDMDFDFALNEALAAEPRSAPVPTPVETETAATPAPTVALPSPPATLPESLPDPATANTPALRDFVQLLNGIAARQERATARDQDAFRNFYHRYRWLLHSGPVTWRLQAEQRMARLAEQQQPLLAALAMMPRATPEAGGVLCVLLINPTWWLYREIRVRARSADLKFTHGGQAVSLRLLDGRDAQPVYLEYRVTRTGPGLAALQLDIDLLDHRGTWYAYRGPDAIQWPLPSSTAGGEAGEALGTESHPDRFWPDSLAMLAEIAALAGPMGAGGSAFTLPLELRTDEERTHRLRAAVVATSQALGRGTPLTRALLLTADPTHAPARIELVSRPFMILGRYNPATGAGFGDFALGFVPEFTRISRLHAVICALGDQLALMPASDQGRTCTRRNGQRLQRGQWYLLETDDDLQICDLYPLKLTLAWDRNNESGPPPDWDPQEPRDKFGHYLLELVDILHQRDQHAGSEDARTRLRNRYINLTLMQDRVAELNGVGNPGALLYARFERSAAAGQPVVHYYVPKWLSLGSSPQAGLRIAAGGVAALQAELLFREGMYWIQNLAGPGSIQVGCHGLATNEVLALEAGDILTIGEARFEFEAY